MGCRKEAGPCLASKLLEDILIEDLLLCAFEVESIGKDVLFCLEDCALLHLKGNRTPLVLHHTRMHQRWPCPQRKLLLSKRVSPGSFQLDVSGFAEQHAMTFNT